MIDIIYIVNVRSIITCIMTLIMTLIMINAKTSRSVKRQLLTQTDCVYALCFGAHPACCRSS